MFLIGKRGPGDTEFRLMLTNWMSVTLVELHFNWTHSHVKSYTNITDLMKRSESLETEKG